MVYIQTRLVAFLCFCLFVSGHPSGKAKDKSPSDLAPSNSPADPISQSQGQPFDYKGFLKFFAPSSETKDPDAKDPESNTKDADKKATEKKGDEKKESKSDSTTTTTQKDTSTQTQQKTSTAQRRRVARGLASGPNKYALPSKRGYPGRTRGYSSHRKGYKYKNRPVDRQHYHNRHDKTYHRKPVYHSPHQHNKHKDGYSAWV